MTRRLLLLLLALVVTTGCRRRGRVRSVRHESLTYPVTRTTDHVDDYHGTKVADPYRWLEDDNAEETKAWVAEQNELTFSYLHSIRARKRIRRRLEKLWNFERYGVPVKAGSRYFFRKNDGLQNQSVLYVADSLDEEPRVFLDPNKLSEDGTVAVRRNLFFSRDGKLLCYAISTAGSDWQEFRVRDVEKGKDLAADELKWIKYSGASWNPEGTGFYYSRFSQPEKGAALTAVVKNQKVYFHRIGTPQSEDRLVYERPDQPEWGLAAEATEDGRYLLIYVWTGSSTHNAIFLQDLGQGGAVIELLKDFDASYDILGNDGSVLYVRTDNGAPKGRIVAIDVDDPKPESWKELVPEGEWAIESAHLLGDRFVVQYLKHAHAQVKLFGLDGTMEREIEMPTGGSAWGFTGRRADSETFYRFSGFTYPATVFRYDFDVGESSVFRRPKVDFDPDDFVSKQVTYPSSDGTKVRMFITHRKDIELDGTNPTLLYGYGGFNKSMTPWFSISNLVWREMGGVYAVPTLRGGGERGATWHQAGMLERKQNVFDDFIAAAEALIYNKYTSSERLAIAGASNGGLLVGACMTQRPDLFGACLPAVGVMDMLRFHKFTIGRAWVSDYGSSDDPAMFKVLHRYSPYHNLRNGVEYPATLVTTADHDDRVVPAHSFKFAARLQACQAGKAPVLIRIETKAGHGAGTPTSKRIDAAADRFAFLVKALGMRR